MNTGKSKDRERIKGRNSLARKVRLIMLCMVLLLSVCFIFSIMYIVRRERRETVMRGSANMLDSLSDSINSDIERYKEISRLIMLDSKLVDYLRAEPETINAGRINNVRYSVLGILNVTTMVDSVFVFRNDGDYIATNRGKYMFDHNRMNSDEWLYNILSQKGGAVISVNGDNALFKIDGSPIVTISRAVYDISTQSKLGIMLMNISDSFLEIKLNSIAGDDIVIVGSDGTYLAGNRDILMESVNRAYDETVYHKVIRDGAYEEIVSGRRISGMPINIITVSRADSGMVMYETVYILLFLLVIFSILILAAGTIISRQLTDPLFALTKAMENNTRKGKLEKIDINIPRNEICVLKDSYNNMVERINELFNNLIEKEKNLQKAEVRVLNEQIKPHFLYNSLETIGFLAMDAGADEVHTALETLGSFYRNFLSKGERIIPLKTEISIIRDYLSLQKLRYGDILNDEYDIASDTRECLIPKLILQPIVENSIYHGIRLKGEMGTISISSFLKDNVLHIIVKDTGVGMEPEQIDEIMNRIRKRHIVIDDSLKEIKDKESSGSYNGDLSGNISSSGSLDSNESFGLWGTILRIQGYCDREDVVSIRSEAGEYTEIEFMIPQKEKNRHNVQGYAY